MNIILQNNKFITYLVLVLALGGFVWAASPKIYPYLYSQSLCFERNGAALSCNQTFDEKRIKTKNLRVISEITMTRRPSQNHSAVFEQCRQKCNEIKTCSVYSVARPREWFDHNLIVNQTGNFTCVIYEDK